MNYKLGSLFDGSGGFPLAGTLCGIEPVWASEVEPYPIAVTRERFPKMKHLGDIRKVNGADIEPVNIITFGSPCQDLSVAGKRAGLKHESNGDEKTTRSGLFMEAVRIIKEMRKATNGMYPRFALWENVQGTFSSNKGEDFRIVCEKLIKIVEPTASMPAVPQKGWNYADSYIGDGWSLAYRVFDAQYWGVPQRRRRIHLVADFRGTSAREVLFERQGVRGYFTQGRMQWQAVTGNAADRTGTASLCLNDQTLFEPCAWDGGNPSCNQGGIAVVAFTQNQRDEVRDLGDRSAVVCANAWTKQQTYVLQGSMIGHEDRNGPQGDGINEDVSFTLNTVDRHAVYSMTTGSFTQVSKEKAPTVLAHDYKDPTAVCYGIGRDAFNQGQNAKFAPTFEEELQPTLVAKGPGAIQSGYTVRRLTPTECARLQGFADDWGHPDHKEDFTDGEYRFWLNVRNTYAAINGKPKKGYTKEQMLTWYNKLHTDSSEYKMWGNGIALPPALYCMQGITDVLNAKED